jgi:hypothetical protein
MDVDELRPSKILIGLLDFLPILRPGALLSYLLMGTAGQVVLGERCFRLAGLEACAVFLLGSWSEVRRIVAPTTV